MSAYHPMASSVVSKFLSLPAQQPEPRLEEPFAFRGVGFLVDLGETATSWSRFLIRDLVFEHQVIAKEVLGRLVDLPLVLGINP